MTDKTEPLSDPFKALLQSVNINPERFNAGITAKKLMKEIKGRNSTRFNNREYYEATGRLETIKSVAERAQRKLPRVYLPIAYVMFVRKATCRHCLAESTCMDAPGLFLLQTDKIGSSTRVFIPVAGVDFPALPHWIKEVKVETAYCLECYSIEQMPEEHNAPTLGPSTPAAGDTAPTPDPVLAIPAGPV